MMMHATTSFKVLRRVDLETPDLNEFV